MANPRLIKKRVNSVKNISKMTRALEMVSASKIQKAQEKALNSKPYAEKVYEIVQDFADKADRQSIPLMRLPHDRSRVLFVLVSTNRGLAGSLNTNLYRRLNNFINNNNFQHLEFIVVGKKGQSFANLRGEVQADYSDVVPMEDAAMPVVSFIRNKFEKEEVDEVYLVYNDFISALEQNPTIKMLLPIESHDLPKESPELMDQKAKEIRKGKSAGLNFETSAEKVLSQLLPFYLEVVVTEVLYEAEASEHSARMIAMKNASENAKNLSAELSLEYNKARQQAITTEISDIVTASQTVN